MEFTTWDQDHDKVPDESCAVTFRGGWWYNYCHHCNPNGLYLHGENDCYGAGITHTDWKGLYYSLINTQIMVRRLM
jgi:ficolin